MTIYICSQCHKPITENKAYRDYQTTRTLVYCLECALEKGIIEIQ